MPASTGGTNVYPSLEDIAQLFRSQINDDMTGQNGTPGEGQIATDINPMTLTFMNSGFRDVWRKLRLVHNQALLYDNYIVENLPVVNGPYGQASPAPETQTYLGYLGFFDGTEMWPNFVLPIGTMNVLRVWERFTESAGPFTPMSEAKAGLPPTYQAQRNGIWEYRGDAIWMPGALVPCDLRIRGTLNFVNYLQTVTNGVGTLDFAHTWFPVQDSTDAVADSMLYRYAMRFAPDLAAGAKQKSDDSLADLRREIISRKQTIENARGDFYGGGDFLPWGNQL